MNKNMKTLCVVLLGLSFLLVQGCATGARVLVNDQDMGRTPAVVCLERDKTYRVILQRGGNESVMNINVGTNSYKPVFFGANLIVDIQNGAILHGIETIDKIGNLNFQREVNINIPQDKDSVVVKFLTEDNSPFEIMNEEFLKNYLAGCQGKDNKKKIPLLLPSEQANERRSHEYNRL